MKRVALGVGVLAWAALGLLGAAAILRDRRLPPPMPNGVTLARQRLMDGDARAAAREYRDYVRLLPFDQAGYYGLGYSLRLGGDAAGEVEAWREAQRVYPPMAGILFDGAQAAGNGPRP